MAWLEGTEEREFVVDAPKEDVAAFFADPDEFGDCLEDMESIESVGDSTWAFTLEEIAAKGVSFQGYHETEYRRDGDVVEWETVGDDNMRTEGKARLEAVDEGRTRVDFEETIGAKLPIPGLMASVFEPIVAREIRKGVGTFLDNAKDELEARFG